MTMCCARRITNGPAASRQSGRCSWRFMRGHLTISEQQGMLKTYDLLLRHFGWETLPKAASATEKFAYLLNRALRSQGIVSLDSICHLDAPSKAGIRKLIEARVRKGELVAVTLDGAGKQEHWTTPAAIEDSQPGRGGAGACAVAIRSPGDPAQATNLFFGHDHRLRGLCAEGKPPARLLRTAGAGG